MQEKTEKTGDQPQVAWIEVLTTMLTVVLTALLRESLGTYETMSEGQRVSTQVTSRPWAHWQRTPSWLTGHYPA